MYNSLIKFIEISMEVNGVCHAERSFYFCKTSLLLISDPNNCIVTLASDTSNPPISRYCSRSSIAWLNNVASETFDEHFWKVFNVKSNTLTIQVRK